MDNILITGANGFVGSKLCEKFLKKGYKIKALVRKTSNLIFLKPFEKKINIVYGDIRDKDSIRKYFKNIDIVIHTAGYASDWGKYSLFYDINVLGTKNVAELALEYNIKHFIHFSSISIYGFGNRVEADENTPIITNKYPYCVTKLEGERTVEHFMKVFSLPATIIQPGQIYGPNDRTMSYKIIEALLAKKFAVCNGGRNLMSPLYIDNLTDAIYLVVKKRRKSIGKKYILTDDVKITWREFTTYFCDYLKAPFPIISLPGCMGRVVGYISEGIYKFFHISTPPLVTLYRVDITCKDFNFTSKKIMKELGYKPDQNVKKNVEKTVEAYWEYIKKIKEEKYGKNKGRKIK